jgi:hypothetical protein
MLGWRISPQEIIYAQNYDEQSLMATTLAKELKVAMLKAQNVPDGLSPLKIVAARPQSANENCNEYNEQILKCVNHIKNVHMVSITFDGLASETNFIKMHLRNFLYGIGNTVAMTDANHAAKAIRSQLVLGSYVVTCGSGYFDVGLLNKAGVDRDLFRVSDYSSDCVILKLCSLETISKLMLLVGSESPHSIVAIAMSLYFLRMFLTAWNSEGISGDNRVSMFWTAWLWFTSTNGIHKLTKQNFAFSCLGGCLLSLQRGISTLRLCTTESIEHAFGTTRSWRREFTVMEFVLYSEKLETILSNVVRYDIRTTTSSKGYMEGFLGFAKAIQKMSRKTMISTFCSDQSTIQIDYERPVSLQLESRLLSIISGTQERMLPLLHTLGFHQSVLSDYCSKISTIQQLNTLINTESATGIITPDMPHVQNLDTQLLDSDTVADISNAIAGFEDQGLVEINNTESDDEIPAELSDYIANQGNSCMQFDQSVYYNLLYMGITSDNVYPLLLEMQRSIACTVMQNKGSASSLQKTMSLKGRWFNTDQESIIQNHGNPKIVRGAIFKQNDGVYIHVLCVFKKSHNKWRFEHSVNENEVCKIHVEQLECVCGGWLQGTGTYKIKNLKVGSFANQEEASLGAFVGLSPH